VTEPSPTRPSPAHTVTFTEGTADVLAEIGQHLQDTLAWTGDGVDSYEQLTERLRHALEEIHSYVAGLHSILRGSRHDQNLLLAPAGRGYARDPGRRSLLFRYTSGLHGALVFWPGGDGRPGRWQIHT